MRGLRPLLVCGLLLCAVGLARADDDDPHAYYSITYAKAKKIAKLADKRVRESSGIACSRKTPGLFWTHNDSGDGPHLYAFDKTGATRGAMVVTGADAFDWEDMASFSMGKKSFLLIADTGNNGRDRDVCTLYLVPEPRGMGTPGKPRPVKVAAKLPFTYPEGAQDCEAIAVDLSKDLVYLATREDHKNLSRVYTLPIPRRTPKSPVAATLVAELPLRKVTGMDMSPDGRRLMIISYAWGYEYEREGERDWKSTLAGEPRKLKLPKRKQGESICYGSEGRALYLTSEKRPTPLYVIPPVEKEPERLEPKPEPENR